MKTYAKRDGAVAALRKLGIPKIDYDLYIGHLSNGKVECNIELATENAPIKKAKKSLVKKVVKKAKASKKAVKSATSKSDKPLTISSRIKELVIAGKTNKEIWPTIAKEFSLKDDKKWYPAWYRNHFKRKGLI